MWLGVYHAFPMLSVISEYDDSLACYSQLYFWYFLFGSENKSKNRGKFDLFIHMIDNKPGYRIFQMQKTPRLSVAFRQNKLYPSSFRPQHCWQPSFTQTIELSQRLEFIQLPPPCNSKSIGYKLTNVSCYRRTDRWFLLLPVC